MSLFGNLTSAGLEETQDRLGGFKVLESGPVTGKIKLAYAGKSANSDAQSVTIVLDTREAGEYRETFWITNKEGKNFSEKDGKKTALTGFTHIDDICVMTTNKPLASQAHEDKVINIYNAELRREAPTTVPMLVELLGKEITFGILKQIEQKQARNATTGVYEDVEGFRETNVTDKVFHYPSNLTMVEAKKGSQTPTFYAAWVEKNKGQTRDRRNSSGGAQTIQGGRAGRPAGGPPLANGAGPVKTTSLFG